MVVEVTPGDLKKEFKFFHLNVDFGREDIKELAEKSVKIIKKYIKNPEEEINQVVFFFVGEPIGYMKFAENMRTHLGLGKEAVRVIPAHFDANVGGYIGSLSRKLQNNELPTIKLLILCDARSMQYIQKIIDKLRVIHQQLIELPGLLTYKNKPYK